MTPVYDPIIAVSFAGLVGSLVAMLFLALARRRDLRRRRRLHATEPTLRMNAIALQALEETLPVSEWHGTLERDVQQLPAMTSSEAGDVIAAREPSRDAIRCPVPAPLAPPTKRIDADATLPYPASDTPARIMSSIPPAPAALEDLGFEGSDDAPTRLEEPLFPQDPPPAPVPFELRTLRTPTPPPVPPAAPGKMPEPLPVYRRAAASSSSHIPACEAPIAAGFTYGDRLRRA